MVSYAQVQAIWTATCTSNPCHDAMVPAEGLNLTAAASYTELVNVTSGQCGSLKLVVPNSPETSYLVFKLQGGGSCFIGSKMPKVTQSLSSAQLQLIRDWIFNGAPMN